MEEFSGKAIQKAIHDMSAAAKEAVERLGTKILPMSMSEFDMRTLADYMLVKATLEKALELMEALVDDEQFLKAKFKDHDEPTEEDYRLFEEYLKNMGKEEE